MADVLLVFVISAEIETRCQDEELREAEGGGLKARREGR